MGIGNECGVRRENRVQVRGAVRKTSARPTHQVINPDDKLSVALVIGGRDQQSSHFVKGKAS